MVDSTTPNVRMTAPEQADFAGVSGEAALREE
jgi:hypothetical protein